MSIFEQIQNDLKAARLAKNELKADTLRTLIGDIQLEATRPGAKNIEDITQAKLKSFTNSAQEFIGFTADAKIKAEKQAEIDIYSAYRPKQMTEDELRAAIVAQFGETLDAKQKGPVMGFLKANHAGNYDGKVAATIIDGLMAK